MSCFNEKAEKFANIIYAPHGIHRPSKEQVIQFAINVMGIDYDEYVTWEKEDFVCDNGTVKIRGEYHPVSNAKGCAILAHGFGQNRYIMLPQEYLFRELGFSTIIFDQRAFGESAEKYCTFGIMEAEDVACVVEWAKRRCGENMKIVLLGVSMGAAASMKALDYTDKIDYLIEDSGFADVRDAIGSLYQSLNGGERNPDVISAFERKTEELGFSMKDNKPVDAVERSVTPICIFHGTADSTIDVSNAEKIYKKCNNSASRMELFVEKEHALCITDEERYRANVKDFLKDLF